MMMAAMLLMKKPLWFMVAVKRWLLPNKIMSLPCSNITNLWPMVLEKIYMIKLPCAN